MRNETSQISTGLRNSATVTTPTSTAAGMVSVITEALLTTIETVEQINQFDTDPAEYIGVLQSINNEILSYKNKSNEIESIQIQLNVGRRSAIQENI